MSDVQGEMGIGGSSAISATLEQAAKDLESVLVDSEAEVDAVSGEFKELAREVEEILSVAAVIVGSVDTDAVRSVLNRVRALGGTASQFLDERLRATAEILETVTAEAKLLARLSELTLAQRSIARETQMLSVLTNIEVARLGEFGTGFQYLAHQLDDFSQAVARGTRELTRHTEERSLYVENTRRTLAVEIPQIGANLSRLESELGEALVVVNARLDELSRTPGRFCECVAAIASQIAEVVAAVQEQDITRQRVEHVRGALQLIRDFACRLENGELEMSGVLPAIVGGLVIQCCQLRSVAETVGDWVSRIRTCMDGILRISGSEVQGIGPAVLVEVRELEEKLGGIEKLDSASQTVNGQVQNTLGGLSNLMRLVGEHLQQSTAVRDQLRLITFNSIIEASHLGSEADAILEISHSIKRLAAVWSEITDQSGRAMEEMRQLMDRVRSRVTHFSEEGSNGLKAAQADTRTGLDSLRRAADTAAHEAQEIEAGTKRLQDRILRLRGRTEGLDRCFVRITCVERQIEELKKQFESQSSGVSGRLDQAKAEKLFAAEYSTEIEREILRAALRGEPLPTRQFNRTGNDAELF